MMDNAGSKTLQFQFWRARRPFNVTPEKERVQQGYGRIKTVNCTTVGLFGKVFKMSGLD